MTLYRVRYICPKTDEIFTLTVWADCDAERFIEEQIK